MSNLPEQALLLLTTLLSPAAKANGLSLKAVPDYETLGVVRSATLMPLVKSVDYSSATRSSSFMSERKVGMSNVSCYVLVLAASQIGPKGATWACEVAKQALDGVRTGPGTAWPELLSATVFVKSIAFTSFGKDQIWQYRVEIDLAVPYISNNLSAQDDLAKVDRLSNVTW